MRIMVSSKVFFISLIICSCWPRYISYTSFEGAFKNPEAVEKLVIGEFNIPRERKPLYYIPKKIKLLKNLSELDLRDNRISNLPTEIRYLMH